MKIIVLLIQFILFSIFAYSQTDSLQSTSLILVNNLDSNLVEYSEPVSMAGALSFSLILPGAGLFLTDNNGPAITYLSVASVSYILGVAFLTAGEGTNEEGALPFFLAGGIVHYIGIIHTLISTLEFNESINPYLTYNGKTYRVGLSINL